MRMSCNGCRVLRKGCSENCSIRPCLQWIKDPESQANATVFLAKFYGRAGLMNLINAGPENLRPAIFRSLLYEACGRIVNPIYGSAGLLSSGSWQLCQSAVEAVLQGTPIMQVAAETAANPSPPLKAYDIRHVSKEETLVFQELHKVKSRNRFKRSAKPKPTADSPAGMDNEQLNNPDSAQVCNLRWRRCYPDDYHRTSDSSSRTEPKTEAETDSMFSVETVEASLMGLANAEGLAAPNSRAYDTEVDLELTLGFEPVSHAARVQATRAIKPEKEFAGDFADTCRMELRLDLSA